MLLVRLLDAARKELTDAAHRYRQEDPLLAKDFRVRAPGWSKSEELVPAADCRRAAAGAASDDL